MCPEQGSVVTERNNSLESVATSLNKAYLKSKVVFNVDCDERLDPVHLAPYAFDVPDEQVELPLWVCS